VENNRGVALILALLVLSFLTVLGGALLTTSTIDIWISDNYKTATQALYLAEAGIDDGRELLRRSGQTVSQLLAVAAGPDGRLSTADDRPLIAFQPLNSGRYEVWLRNDNADGVTSLVDSNEVVTLISIASARISSKTIEVTIKKGKFPETPADPHLSTVSGLEALAGSIGRNAMDSYATASLGNVGNPANYRVVVVNGHAELGPGAGYGLLLVRGELNVIGNITWNGLIVVIGQGVIRWNAPAIVNGGVFVARTQAANGTLLSLPQGVSFSVTDANQLRAANRSFPYSPIAVRER